MIDERWPQVVSGSLPIYTGRPWFTDCTCIKREPGRVQHDGQWTEICMRCGSTRTETNT
jgi:hypothetical protein